MQNCPDCGKFMKKEIVKGGYIQETPEIRYTVKHWLLCKCGKFFIVSSCDALWE